MTTDCNNKQGNNKEHYNYKRLGMRIPLVSSDTLNHADSDPLGLLLRIFWVAWVPFKELIPS